LAKALLAKTPQKRGAKKGGHLKGQISWEHRSIYLVNIKIMDAIIDVLSRKRRHERTLSVIPSMNHCAKNCFVAYHK